MKTTLLVLLLSGVAVACPKGYTEWEGNCSEDQVPQQAEPVKPSSEKPRHNGIPAWQAGEVKAAEPASLKAWDEAGDRAKDKANAEGKKAADIK